MGLSTPSASAMVQTVARNSKANGSNPGNSGNFNYITNPGLTPTTKGGTSGQVSTPAMAQGGNSASKGASTGNPQSNSTGGQTNSTTNATSSRQVNIVKWRRAFKKWVFYFDGVDTKERADLEKRCKELGAKVVLFVDLKQITHIITSKTTEEINEITSGQNSNQPATAITSVPTANAPANVQYPATAVISTAANPQGTSGNTVPGGENRQRSNKDVTAVSSRNASNATNNSIPNNTPSNSTTTSNTAAGTIPGTITPAGSTMPASVSATSGRNNLLYKAQSFKIKIWTVDSAHKIINTLSGSKHDSKPSRLQDHLRNEKLYGLSTNRDPENVKNGKSNWYQFKGKYLLIEELSERFKPIMAKEYKDKSPRTEEEMQADKHNMNPQQRLALMQRPYPELSFHSREGKCAFVRYPSSEIDVDVFNKRTSGLKGVTGANGETIRIRSTLPTTAAQLKQRKAIMQQREKERQRQAQIQQMQQQQQHIQQMQLAQSQQLMNMDENQQALLPIGEDINSGMDASNPTNFVGNGVIDDSLTNKQNQGIVVVGGEEEGAENAVANLRISNFQPMQSATNAMYGPQHPASVASGIISGSNMSHHTIGTNTAGSMGSFKDSINDSRLNKLGERQSHLYPFNSSKSLGQMNSNPNSASNSASNLQTHSSTSNVRKVFFPAGNSKLNNLSKQVVVVPGSQSTIPASGVIPNNSEFRSINSVQGGAPNNSMVSSNSTNNRVGSMNNLIYNTQSHDGTPVGGSCRPNASVSSSGGRSGMNRNGVMFAGSAPNLKLHSTKNSSQFKEMQARKRYFIPENQKYIQEELQRQQIHQQMQLQQIQQQHRLQIQQQQQQMQQQQQQQQQLQHQQQMQQAQQVQIQQQQQQQQQRGQRPVSGAVPNNNNANVPFQFPKTHYKGRSGVCENCNVRFDVFEQHITTRQHRMWARNESNFGELDILIARMSRRSTET